MYPEITVKSSDIYTFDTFYNKVIENEEVRNYGFFNVSLYFSATRDLMKLYRIETV